MLEVSVQHSTKKPLRLQQKCLKDVSGSVSGDGRAGVFGGTPPSARLIPHFTFSELDQLGRQS